MDFSLATASRLALQPMQSPIQWVPLALSPGIKRALREADYSPPSSAEINNAIPPRPHTFSYRGV
jgi:hypothetical protein